MMAACRPWGAVLLLCLPLWGCSPTRAPAKEPATAGFELTDVAKTDLNLFLETNRREVMGHLRTLVDKLYQRNPFQLRRSRLPSRPDNLQRMFDRFHNWKFSELNDITGVDCIQLAFDETFQGDRVLALGAGLGSMLQASYNNKREFYVLDSLDPQKLYNSARNLELVAWKLSRTRTSQGELFLLSNEVNSPTPNLSFERQFGKMIAIQDSTARVVAQKTRRLIKDTLQFLVFLPI